MYALNVDEYAHWSAIESKQVRFWVRTWVDALHAGTHIHWQLSPISTTSLGALWEFFDLQEDKYVRHQRDAIKRLSHRLPNDPSIVGALPQLHASNARWAAFFAQQRERQPAIRASLLAWTRDCLASAGPAELFDAMNLLFAALSLQGFSTDSLLRAVGNRVIVPGDVPIGSTCEERLLAMLELWRDATPRPFLAYTPINCPNDVSRTLLNKWSSRCYETIDVFDKQGTQAVQIGSKDARRPYIVSGLERISGVPETHRREARRAFAIRLRSHPELSCFSFPDRSFFRRDEPGATEHYCDVGFARVNVDLEGLPVDAGAEFYLRASRDLFDVPHEAIRSLMVASELMWGHDCPQVLANAYRWHLRRALSNDVSAYMARVRSIVEKRGAAKYPVLRIVGTWSDPNRSALLERIRTEAPGVDAALEYRLQEINDWQHRMPDSVCMSGRPCTFENIDSYVTLIRGIRNSATHFESPPEALYGVILYLAKIAFRAFAAACMRSQIPSSSIAPAA